MVGDTAYRQGPTLGARFCPTRDTRGRGIRLPQGVSPEFLGIRQKGGSPKKVGVHSTRARTHPGTSHLVAGSCCCVGWQIGRRVVVELPGRAGQWICGSELTGSRRSAMPVAVPDLVQCLRMPGPVLFQTIDEAAAHREWVPCCQNRTNDSAGEGIGCSLVARAGGEIGVGG